jgi:hypothetical protein
VKPVGTGHLDGAFVAPDSNGSGVREPHAAGDLDLRECRVR